MPFTKGQSGNIKGRPKNTFTYSYKLRQIVNEFCENNATEFLNDIKKMKPGHAKAQAFISLLNFCLPKITEQNSIIDLQSIPDHQINYLIKKLINDEGN